MEQAEIGNGDVNQDGGEATGARSRAAGQSCWAKAGKQCLAGERERMIKLHYLLRKAMGKSLRGAVRPRS